MIERVMVPVRMELTDQETAPLSLNQPTRLPHSRGLVYTKTNVCPYVILEFKNLFMHTLLF